MMEIRIAIPEDAAGILEIYTPIVEQTPISFELSPPDEAEIAARISKTLEHYPYLVCVDDDTIVGYVYGSVFRSRPAYQWTTEVTVYVHDNYRRRNIARALYTALFELLKQQGFVTALAVITLPNDASIYLHNSMGFKSVGIFHKVGYKLNKWHDSNWLELSLSSGDEAPATLIKFPDLPTNSIYTVLEQAVLHLNKHDQNN